MTSSLSDEDLVARTLAGENDAFSELYDRYRRPVYSTAYRIIQDPEESLDATQEIFVKLYHALPVWNARKAKFSTWLYRLAANHAIDCWRARRRRAESSLEEIDAVRAPGRERLHAAIRSPYREIEGKERVEQVRHCIERLPDLQKKIFVLRFFEELKLEEIAQIENCSLGTVKTSLFRATQSVRRCFRGARNAS